LGSLEAAIDQKWWACRSLLHAIRNGIASKKFGAFAFSIPLNRRNGAKRPKIFGLHTPKVASDKGVQVLAHLTPSSFLGGSIGAPPRRPNTKAQKVPGKEIAVASPALIDPLSTGTCKSPH
jgi:hypothetical protein